MLFKHGVCIQVVGAPALFATVYGQAAPLGHPKRTGFDHRCLATRTAQPFRVKVFLDPPNTLFVIEQIDDRKLHTPIIPSSLFSSVSHCIRWQKREVEATQVLQHPEVGTPSSMVAPQSVPTVDTEGEIGKLGPLEHLAQHPRVSGSRVAGLTIGESYESLKELRFFQRLIVLSDRCGAGRIAQDGAASW